jgi:hypothetical protein
MQKTYCVNTKCAKPIEYSYSKPNFCPHCGESLTLVLRPITKLVANRTAEKTPSRSFTNSNPSFAGIEKRMSERTVERARRSNLNDFDSELDEAEEDSVPYDFSGFQIKASVHRPPENRITLGEMIEENMKTE